MNRSLPARSQRRSFFRRRVAGVIAVWAALAFGGGPAALAAISAAAAAPTGARAAHAMLRVIAADELIGRSLRDPNGLDAGQIRAVIIDIRSGAVEFVAVGSRGSFNLANKLIALPWTTLVAPRGTTGPITEKVAVNRLLAAPRIDQQSLMELYRPDIRASNYRYYGPPPYYAFAPAGHLPPRATGFCSSGRTPPINPRPNAPDAHARNSLVAGGLVIGRGGVVSALCSPATTSTQSLRQANVLNESGKTVGHIDHVFIDAARGEVAFVLVRSGGFLGLRPISHAVPLQALVWVPYPNNNYRLTVSQKRLESEGPVEVRDQHFPTKVSRHDLAQLYRYFDISPYWTNAGKVQAAKPERRQIAQTPRAAASR